VITGKVSLTVFAGNNSACSSIAGAWSFNGPFGGDWRSFKDYPHLQMLNGMTIPQMRQLYEAGLWPIP